MTKTAAKNRRLLIPTLMIGVASFSVQPAYAEDAGANGSPVETAGPKQDAGLRTFAGRCLVEPRGADEQAALFGSLAGLIPAFAGTGIDLLTGALEAAGREKVLTLQATLPLEHRPFCIQIARLPNPTTAELISAGTPGKMSTALQAALKRAPFLVEFYLRQSHDGSAISIMPTVLRYNRTLDGKSVSSSARDLAATISFTTLGEPAGSAVTVPLGSHAPRANSDPHYFDPIMGPTDPAGSSPAGAAASRWIKSPYAAAGEGAPSDPQALAKSTSEEPDTGEIRPTVPGNERPPPPVTTVLGGRTESSGAARSPRPKEQSVPSLQQSQQINLGDRTQPFSVTVDLREARPGSSFARILASFLKTNRQAVVDVFDRTKQQEARTKELQAWQAAQSSYAAALADYYKKRGVYCAEATGAAAADLLASQVNLGAAARIAGESRLPFRQLIDPQNPYVCA